MNYLTFKRKTFARFKKRILVSKLAALLGYELKPKKWVFIIGCYNSGTTLLSEILNKHPKMEALPDEGVMLTNKLPRPEDFGWRRMWCQCEDKMRIDVNQAAKISGVIKRHWSHFVKRNPEIVVEKSIANATRLEFFQTHFPNSYFIYIVRNGYAAAEGISRKAEVMEPNKQIIGENYPIDYAIRQWKRSIEVVEEQKPKIANFLEISYEELTDNLENTATRITDFLAIEKFSHEILKGDFIVHRKKMKIANQNDKSFVKLSPADWITMNNIAEKELRKYNYYSEIPIKQ
jgi:hypothetical protein